MKCPQWHIVMQHKNDLIAVHGAGDPGIVVAHFGVDTRLVPLSTAVTPGHNALQLIVAHDWATRISLERKRQEKWFICQ